MQKEQMYNGLDYFDKTTFTRLEYFAKYLLGNSAGSIKNVIHGSRDTIRYGRPTCRPSCFVSYISHLLLKIRMK